MQRLVAFCLVAFAWAGCSAPEPVPSPYAQWAGNEVRALPPETVQALQDGGGAGYALAAELNGYPGPRHVLDLADDLGLDAQQRARTQELLDGMRHRAVPLGQRVLAEHVTLEGMFRNGTATPEGIAARTAAVAALEGELRAVHLETHVRMKEVLDAHQVQRYQDLRGYAGAHGDGHPAH